MLLELLPSEILQQITRSLDRLAIWALCLTSAQLHRDFQPSLLISKGSLDRAYAWSVRHGDVALLRQVLQRGKYRNLSALCLAAKHGHIAIIDELLQGYHDDGRRESLLTGVTMENKNWGHPLATAVKAGHIQMIKRLLELEGMDIDSLNRQEWYHTPLDRAIKSCKLKALELLIENGANLTIERVRKPFPIATALVSRRYDAVEKLHAAGGADNIPIEAWIEVSEDIASADYFDPSCKDDKNMKPFRLLFAVAPQLATADRIRLDLAAGLGLDTLRATLKSKPDLSGSKFSWAITSIATDRTSAYCATPSEKIEMCKLLIECGAQLNADDSDVDFWNRYEITEQACENFVDPELLEYLFTLPGCPSATKALVRAKSTDIIRLLLEKGADVHDTSNDLHTTALLSVLDRGPLEKAPGATVWHRPIGQGAGYQDWRESIELLIDHGADISLVGWSGGTAMSCAVEGGADEDLLQWLMDHGAHMTAPEGHKGLYCHPLLCLRRTDISYRYRTAQWILRYGNVSNEIGMKAINSVCWDIDVKTIKVLLDHGITLADEDDDTTNTCLQMLGYYIYGYPGRDSPSHWPDHIEATRLLLASGAKMFFTSHDEEDQSPRKMLPRIVNADHFQVFLDYGLPADQDINWHTRGLGFEHMHRHQGDHSGTVLHYAVQRHKMAFVTKALDAGASPFAKNLLGQTPWELAKALPLRCKCGFMEQLGASPVNTEKQKGVKRAWEGPEAS